MIAGHITSQVRAFVERRERSGRGHRRQWSCARVYARGCGGCTSGRAEGCATRERGLRGDGQSKSMFSDKGSYAFRRRLPSCPPLRQARLDIARLSISPRPPEAKRQDKTSRTKRKLNFKSRPMLVRWLAQSVLLIFAVLVISGIVLLPIVEAYI